MSRRIRCLLLEAETYTYSYNKSTWHNYGQIKFYSICLVAVLFGLFPKGLGQDLSSLPSHLCPNYTTSRGGLNTQCDGLPKGLYWQNFRPEYFLLKKGNLKIWFLMQVWSFAVNWFVFKYWVVKRLTVYLRKPSKKALRQVAVRHYLLYRTHLDFPTKLDNLPDGRGSLPQWRWARAS